MINNYIFNKNYIGLFSPYSNEYLYNYIYELGYTDKDSGNWKCRFIVLSTINYLLENKIIYIYDWPNHPSINKKLSNEDIIKTIDKSWLQESKYPDFFGMVIFGTSQWYKDNLERLGMTIYTDWNKFVQSEIGDLEKWIENNKPKY